MAQRTCESCSGPVDGSGRGRPRRFCLTCRPRQRELSTPRERSPECKVCGADAVGLGYCSAACKWAASPRAACVICGGPTGWRAGSTSLTGDETCLECRRDPAKRDHGTYANYRRGCRCSACVQANRDEWKAYRDRRRAAGNQIKRFGSSGPWIAPSVRLAVFERDAWTCQLCGEAVQPDANPQSDWYPSLDHIVPKSRGGAHSPENLRTAHRWCNSIRGAGDFHSDLFEVAQ